MSDKNNKSDNTEVLSYKIDTTEFDRGMDRVIAALEKVEKREYLAQLQTSIDGIGASATNINFNNMEQGLATVQDRFSTMGVVGMSVINNLTNAVMNFAQQFVFDKLLGDAASGLQEFNLQINSTQTILANTASRFGTTLADVNSGLATLNTYADKTIYNFSDMTQGMGAFTSAGVDLGNSIQGIKGVANMAAYAGASAEAASSGMYQFSNALSMGYMMLYQWNSLIYTGLGTKTLETEMIASARGLGKDIDNILKEYGGSFKYSLESGWADQEVIMHTLAKFSGDVTEEQLRAMEYTEEEIQRILVLGKTATDAATKVTTYEKLVMTLTEAVGSGWARTFNLVIGDFEQGKALFTMIADNLMTVIERGSENRNKLASDWSKFGGRDVVIESIDKLLKTYSQLLIVLGQSVNQIFPPLTGKMLADGTKWLGKFLDALIPTQKGLSNIGRIITGLAATFDIPLQFFKALGRYLYDLIKPMLKFNFTWVDSITSIADFMTKLRNEIVKGDLFFKKITEWGDGFKFFIGKIKKFFDDVQKLDAVKKMTEIFNAITMRFGLKDPNFLTKFLSDAQKSFKTFFDSFDKVGALTTIQIILDTVIGFGKDVYKFFEPAITYVIELVGNFAKAFGLAVKDLSTNFTWDKLKDVLGILTKFLTLKTINQLMEHFGFATEIFMKLGMGFAETIGYIGTALQQFAGSNDADTLLSIAIALGILSASIFMLSTVPQEGIDKGIKAITTVYVGLASSLVALNLILNGSNSLTAMAGGALKLALLPPVLIALAGAVAIMAYTLTKLGAVPMKQLIKGFGAMMGILGALQIFMIVDSKLGGMSLTSGLGMVAIAVSLTILAKAIAMFSDIKIDTMGRAALAVGSLLIVVGLMSKAKLIGPQMLILGVSITGIAASLVVLGLAFKFLGSIDFSAIATGLANVLVMLGAIYFASFVGNGIRIPAILKLAAMSIAIAGLGVAFVLIAQIDPQKVILASTAVGLGIGILYAAVSFIQPNVLESIGLLALLSAGIAVFAVSLYAFKNVDFAAVALGGAALGVLVLAMMTLAGLTIAFPPLAAGLTAVALILLTAGAALMLFGASALFAGAGFKLFAEGLVMLADGGDRMISSFIRNIPKFGDAIVQLATVGAKAAISVVPQITTAGTVIIVALAKSIIAATPYVVTAMIAVVNGIYDFFASTGTRMATIFGIILLDVYKYLDKNIETYTVLGNRILTKYINGMAKTIGPLVAALYNYFIVLMGATADTIEKDGAKLRAQARRLANVIVKFFIDGLTETGDMVDEGMVWLTRQIISSGWKAAVTKDKDIVKIGMYVVTGLIRGLLDPTGLGSLTDAIGSISDMMINGLRRGLDENSPSKEAFQITDYFMQGLNNGLDPSTLTTKLVSVKDAMLNFMDGALSADLNFQPTLSPVLDLGAMAAIEKTVSSAFGAQQFNLGMSPGFSLNSNPVGTQMQGPTAVQTAYNQYITSASPLSVEEVARRTKSLIGQSRRS